MDTAINLALALGGWAVLVRCAVAALSDWQRQQRGRAARAGRDRFAASAARWGYVGERRGAGR